MSVPEFLFVYDEAGHLIGKYDGGGNPLQETAWLGDLPVAVLEPAGKFYIAPDHLGSPHQITDAGGATVWLWHPDPFGKGDPTGAFSYDLRFPGQFNDQATHLNYNYFRDYDPRLGRYIESDPIGLAGGLNTYAYVNGNPVTFADAFGLFTFGGGVSGSGQVGPVNINGSITLMVDGNGNLGVVSTIGVGDGLGAGVAGGFTVGGSNAKKICDLGGPFGNGNITAGAGPGGSLDIYSGPSDHGQVTGGGITLGPGFGAGGGVGGSYTWVTPIGF